MQDFILPATQQTPEVRFRPATRELSLRGESFPENAVSFYGPVFQALKACLDAAAGQELSFEIALAYYNSASTKAIFRLVQICNEAAAAGTKVVVRWLHDPDDDNLRDMGLDLKEEFGDLRFEVLELA